MNLTPFLALVALAAQISFAAETKQALCDRYTSAINSRPTFQLFSAEKNSEDLFAVARFMAQHEDMMTGMALTGKDFVEVRNILRKGGLALETNQWPYLERIYQKTFVAKNCPDANLEANSTIVPETQIAPGTTPEPNDDFYGRHVDDATRGTNIDPGGTTVPAETER